MKKPIIEMSKYIDWQCCSQCDYFEDPDYVFGEFYSGSRRVCPECGEPIVRKIGRFEIEKTKTFFGSENRKYIRFELKAKGESHELSKNA